MFDRFFTVIASMIAGFAVRPSAFILATVFILVWAVTGPIFAYSDTWQLVVNTATTIVTFLMVFLIQNSQNRDDAAMQDKLDGHTRTLDGPRQGFTGRAHQPDTEGEEISDAREKANIKEAASRRSAVQDKEGN